MHYVMYHEMGKCDVLKAQAPRCKIIGSCTGLDMGITTIRTSTKSMTRITVTEPKRLSLKRMLLKDLVARFFELTPPPPTTKSKKQKIQYGQIK